MLAAIKKLLSTSRLKLYVFATNNNGGKYTVFDRLPSDAKGRKSTNNETAVLATAGPEPCHTSPVLRDLSRPRTECILRNGQIQLFPPH